MSASALPARSVNGSRAAVAVYCTTVPPTVMEWVVTARCGAAGASAGCGAFAAEAICPTQGRGAESARTAASGNATRQRITWRRLRALTGDPPCTSSGVGGIGMSQKRRATPPWSISLSRLGPVVDRGRIARLGQARYSVAPDTTPLSPSHDVPDWSAVYVPVRRLPATVSERLRRATPSLYPVREYVVAPPPAAAPAEPRSCRLG